MSEDNASEMIFIRDISEIKKSDALIFIMDGRVPDEGACIEVGFAAALGKKCIGLKTDSRTLLYNMDNPMISGALNKQIAKNLEELLRLLEPLKKIEEKAQIEIINI